MYIELYGNSVWVETPCTLLTLHAEYSIKTEWVYSTTHRHYDNGIIDTSGTNYKQKSGVQSTSIRVIATGTVSSKWQVCTTDPVLFTVLIGIYY